MGSYDDSKRKQHGREYDQLTHDGTGNVGSVGPGGTGDIDRSLQTPQDGSRQSAGRTDDLLAGGPEGTAKGFRDPGDLQTGLGGTGSLGQGGAAKQGGAKQAGAGGSMQGDRAAENEAPPSDARVSHKSDRA